MSSWYPFWITSLAISHSNNILGVQFRRTYLLGSMARNLATFKIKCTCNLLNWLSSNSTRAHYYYSRRITVTTWRNITAAINDSWKSFQASPRLDWNHAAFEVDRSEIPIWKLPGPLCLSKAGTPGQLHLEVGGSNTVHAFTQHNLGRLYT